MSFFVVLASRTFVNAKLFRPQAYSPLLAAIDQVNSTRVDCDYPAVSVETGTAGDAVGAESGCGSIVELMGN
eukprot:230968-Hanusia_phi.AAC.1